MKICRLRTARGSSYHVARTSIKGDPIHDSDAPHPFPITFCTGFAQLFGLPLCYRDRRGTVRPHQPIANEASLRPEDGNAVGVDLIEDAFSFRRVEIDVPVSNGYPQISGSDGLLLFHQ